MSEIQNTPQEAVKVTSSAAKFFIGAVAGCSVAVIPRLSSYVISPNADDVSNYFSMTYIVSVIIFSVFIGLVIMITEYKFPKPPKETFFAALAIPGLIAGSLNTTAGTIETNNMHQETVELREHVQSINNIKTEAVDSLEVINLGMIQKHNNEISFNLVTNAYADDPTNNTIQKEDPSNFSFQIEDSEYVISIGTFTNLDEAKTEAKRLQQDNPSITLIKTKNAYELLLDDETLTETTATIKAMKAKKELGVNPKLLMLR